MTGRYWIVMYLQDGYWPERIGIYDNPDTAIARALRSVRKSKRSAFRSNGEKSAVQIYKVTVKGADASEVAYVTASHEHGALPFADDRVIHKVDPDLQPKVNARWLHYLKNPRKPKPRKEEEEDD
jgi:hypothetical protein